MIVLLAAATMMLSADPAVRQDVEAANPFLRMAQARHCPGAGRLQTRHPEPALLYRERDQAAGRLRKLIDLPQGEKCLVAAPPAHADVQK